MVVKKLNLAEVLVIRMALSQSVFDTPLSYACGPFGIKIILTTIT